MCDQQQLKNMCAPCDSNGCTLERQPMGCIVPTEKGDYTNIQCFGSAGCGDDNDINNPLTYILPNELDSNFLHGSGAGLYDRYSKNGQIFAADYCANNWNGVCDLLSLDQQYAANSFPLAKGFGGTSAHVYSGDILIGNTCRTKYLLQVLDKYGQTPVKPIISPYNPIQSDGYNISYYPDGCVPVYGIKDPKNLDNDPVMQRLLSRPMLAPDVLVNIFNTHTRMGKMKDLLGTNLYKFFKSNYFKQMKQNMMSSY